MKSGNQPWTKEEFHTYLLIYSMNADYSESQNELDIIKNRVGETTYSKMHSVFEKDNDYQSIQKVQKAIDDLNYSKEEVTNLFTEIKELFLSDGKFDILEQNLMLGLKKILNT